MAKRLSDRTMQSMKPAKKGSRYDVRDVVQGGLVVRVSDTGSRVFSLQARFPGGAGRATRRTLGLYPDMTLEEARDKARRWRRLIRDGIDPSLAEQEANRTLQRREANNFERVAEAFIAHCRRAGQRKAPEIEKDLQREFLPFWARRPITSITSSDVREIVNAKAQSHPAQAHNLLGTIRRLFNWARGTDAYGLDTSPCDRIRPADAIGRRAVRDRILSEDEIRAFWNASEKMGYPYGPLFRLLLLTIQRKSDIADAVWNEVDLTSRFNHVTNEKRPLQIGVILEIPKERMKMKRAHLVPLAPMAADLFASLPRFDFGPHLFTTTLGAKPINGFSKAKARLDELMGTELRKMAKMRGEDPAKVEPKPWVIHDLRRTGRTKLAALRVPHLWSERVIAHVKRGLDQNYDQHDYLAEKREALELWATHLSAIIGSAVDERAGISPR